MHVVAWPKYKYLLAGHKPNYATNLPCHAHACHTTDQLAILCIVPSLMLKRSICSNRTFKFAEQQSCVQHMLCLCELLHGAELMVHYSFIE